MVLLIILFPFVAQASAEFLKINGIRCEKKYLEFYQEPVFQHQSSKAYAMDWNWYFEGKELSVNPVAEPKERGDKATYFYATRFLDYWRNILSWVYVSEDSKERHKLGIAFRLDEEDDTYDIKLVAHSDFEFVGRYGMSNETDDFETTWLHLFHVIHVLDWDCNYRFYRYGIGDYWFATFLWFYDPYSTKEHYHYARLGRWYYYQSLDPKVPFARFIIVNNISNYENDTQCIIIYDDSTIGIGTPKDALNYNVHKMPERRKITLGK